MLISSYHSYITVDSLINNANLPNVSKVQNDPFTSRDFFLTSHLMPSPRLS